MKRLILILFLLFIPFIAWGADYYCSPDGSGTTCSEGSPCALEYCIETKASSGDTVHVTAGEYTQNAQVEINKELDIIGAGYATTIINHGYSGSLFYVSPNSDVPIRISGIHFKSSTNNSGYPSIYIRGSTTGGYNLSQVRIDHNKIEKGSHAVYAVGRVEGCIDNNTFLNCNIAVMVLGDDNYSWAREIAAGTSNSLFIEDNTFTVNNSADREPNEQIYHQEGGRTVIRYNTFDGSAYTSGNYFPFDSHGNQKLYASGTFRGQPLIEFYNNTINTYQTYRMFNIRGGSVLMHHNTMTRTSGSGNIFYLQDEESWQTAFFNPLDTVWPAEDQINNSFFWENTLNGETITSVTVAGTNGSTFIQEDRDYFFHAPQNSGGYEYYDDRQGAAGNASDGTLNWDGEHANAYYPYTSYTYPHPLRGGTAAPSGTVVVAGGIVESEVVSGGKTLVITLTDDTWDADIGTDCAETTALIAGIDSNKSEANGWDAVVKAGLDYEDVTRTSDTVVTITLPAFAGYDITQSETVTVTIPTTCVASAVEITASPSFIISVDTTPNVTGKAGVCISGGVSATHESGGFNITAP